jgi:hypothetical protein
MRISSQNLNERGREIVGSMFWHGRAWLRNTRHDELGHVEWCFGKHARGFAVTIGVGAGESENFIRLHICVPWLFSVYLLLPAFRCKERKTGIAIHNGSFWVYPWVTEWESRSEWPWWKKCHAWNFPWTLDHYRTEILTHEGNVVFVQMRGQGKLGDGSFERRQHAEKANQKTYDYIYTLKNGTVQKRTAAVHVERMEWRARWWPIIRRKQIRISIDVNFNEEVGEKSGSWKGGCVGCSYDMLPNETPEQCLRRMERERKF